MAQENLIRIPQALRDVFAGYNLEIPPLPKNALPLLSQAGSELFATDALPDWLLRGAPAHLSFADLEIPETAHDDAEESSTELPYFFCGFHGSGFQNRAFLYSYVSRHLRVGITLPFNHTYADPEREREGVNRAMELLTLVLLCTREGANMGTDGPGTFSWITDWHGSSFQLCNGNGEIVLTGNTADALLDYLEQRRNAVSEDAVESRFWVKV